MATTNCTRGEAIARRRSDELTRSSATIAEEFLAGRVGIAQVRELARLAANPRTGDQLESDYQVQRTPDGVIQITRLDGTHLQLPDAA